MMKIYQAIQDKILSISIDVDGKELRITFSGGDAASNGVYNTGNPDIQEALESSGMFNKYYRLVKSIPPKTSPLTGPGVAVNGVVSSYDLKANGLLAGQTAIEQKVVTEVVTQEQPVNETEAAPAETTAPEVPVVPEAETAATDEASEKAPEAGPAEDGPKVDSPEPEAGSEDITDETSEKVEEAAANAEVTKFRNVAEAQDFFMKEPYKILKSKLTTSKAVMEVAEQLGVAIKFER